MRNSAGTFRSVSDENSASGSQDPRTLPELSEIAASAEVYDGSNKLMIPGFVNAHSHIPMTLLRGYGEGLSLHDWLEKRIYPFEAQMTVDDMYWGPCSASRRCCRAGDFIQRYVYAGGWYRTCCL